MARSRYRASDSHEWFFSRAWTKVVPAGTKGARRGFIAGEGTVWFRPRKVSARKAAWRLKQRREKWV